MLKKCVAIAIILNLLGIAIMLIGNTFGWWTTSSECLLMEMVFVISLQCTYQILQQNEDRKELQTKLGELAYCLGLSTKHIVNNIQDKKPLF